MRILLTSFIILLPFLSLAENSEFKIGWIGPLTGDAAILGQDTIPAIQIAFDKSDQTKPRLVVEDDQYITAKTIQAYQRLVHVEKVSVIFMLTYGGVFALADRAKRDNVLLIDTLDCDEQIAKLPDNVICISKMTEELGRMNAEEALKRKDTPAAIIYYDSDPFMGTIATISKSTFENAGKSVVSYEGYRSGTTDFKSTLLKAKSEGAKAFFFYGYDEIGNAMKQARELGISAQFYGINTVTSPGLQAIAGDSLNNILISTFKAPRTSRYNDFITEFKKRTGRVPNFEVSTFPSYDAATLIVKALKENFSTAHIKKILLTTKNFQGLSGTITVDPDGATRSIHGSLFKIEDGELRDITN